MQDKKYFIGLDIGTNSVGWACIDENYRLLRFRGKNMWGTRLIDNVDTAEKRRFYRSSRRCYERRRERIRILQGIFSEEIKKVDMNFFRRMKESFLLTDEKSGQNFGKNNIHILFDDKNYNDRDFYRLYPTIYHLRRAIMDNPDKKFDIREVYLAIHHILKFRGNFLYKKNEIAELGDPGTLIGAYFNFKFEEDERFFITDGATIDRIKEIIEDNEIPKYIKKNMREVSPEIKTKEERVEELFENKEDKESSKNFVRAILGYSFSIDKALKIPDLKKDGKEYKIKFDDKFEESRDDAYNAVEEFGKGEILEILEKCRNSLIFRNIMGKDVSGKMNKRISDAKIDAYERHKKDLQLLKSLVKLVDESLNKRGDDGSIICEQYNLMFRKNNYKGCNYANYVKNQQNIKHVKNDERYSRANQEKFYEFVERFCDNISKKHTNPVQTKIDELRSQILFKIANHEFMPRQNDIDNGIIPYQMHEKELEKILENQGRYYPFLKDNAQNIMSILTFRRPYYVGVLKSSMFGWSNDETGKPLYPTGERLYPWNLMDKIDKDKFAENFIKKLSGRCQIFPDEDTLPKKSIRYQAYCVLNELNSLKIDEKPISPDLKKHLFDNLFCKQKTVTVSALCRELKKYEPNLYGDINWKNISGISRIDEKKDAAEFNNNMSSLRDFKHIMGNDFDIGEIDKYDEIIKILSIFKDKDVVRKRIGKILNVTDQQKYGLSNLSYSGWGRYSKKFLDEIRDSNNRTVLEELYVGFDKYKRCYNIQTLKFNKEFNFKLPEAEGIKKYDYDRHIKNLYCSPKVKPLIWQSICVVEEIVAIMKSPPSYIFVETTREDNAKKQTVKRYTLLENLYKSINDPENKDMQNIIRELRSYKENGDALLNDKLFLYFAQQCKCMYSGERLEIERLAEYEIDHIVPRCWIKDDSLSNRVLVKKIENQRKSHDLTLKDEIINRQRTFWKDLCDREFISKKKYYALTRSEFTEKEIGKFIQRQIVETSQIVKETMNLLARKYGRENVKGVKSRLISQFRVEQMLKGEKGFAKIRDLNDMHHAKDAYLAAALGDFAINRTYSFQKDEYFGLVKEDMRKIALKADSDNALKDLIEKKNGFILELLENGCPGSLVIDPETGELLQNRFNNILAMMSKNDCIVTKKLDEKSNTDFYKQTIYSMHSKGPDKPAIPLRYMKDKNGISQPLDVRLYGGYSGEKPEYCIIVKHKIKDKTIKSKKGDEIYKDAFELENVPVLIAYKERSNPGELQKYIMGLKKNNCSNVPKYREPEIMEQAYKGKKMPLKICKNQLITLNGQWVYIVSDKEVNNAVQLVVDEKFEKLLYFVDKYDFSKGDIEQSIRDDQLRNEYKKLKSTSGSEYCIADMFVLYFIEKLNKHYPLYKNIADKINEFYNRGAEEPHSYQKLRWDEKCEFIKKLLLITKTGPAGIANMNNYGEGSAWGRLTNRRIDCGIAQWMCQSITGLHWYIPQKRSVMSLEVTEKQVASMDCLLGEKNTDVIDNTDKLVII